MTHKDPDSGVDGVSGMRNLCIIIPATTSRSPQYWRVSRMAGRRPDLHFLFVDDGSTDGTGGILNHLNRACPEQIRHITMERNLARRRQ